jgi:hypothetical protein
MRLKPIVRSPADDTPTGSTAAARLTEIEMVRFTVRSLNEIVAIPMSEIALTTITLNGA